MLKTFRTYQLSIRFYRACESLKLPRHLREQLLRASSSIVLNLAEGHGKPTRRDQLKFFFIAVGSLRECEAVLAIAPVASGGARAEALALADHLGACLYRLTEAVR